MMLTDQNKLDRCVIQLIDIIDGSQLRLDESVNHKKFNDNLAKNCRR